MPLHSVDFDTVRKLAHEIGSVKECTVHGAPSLKVRGQLLACIAVHKSAEPGSLVVRIDASQRAKLIASAADVYYVTDHYVKYPTVLVRLSRIQPEALKALLGIAWSYAQLRPHRGKRTARKQSGPRRGRAKSVRH
jgi:hypothetical protein